LNAGVLRGLAHALKLLRWILRGDQQKVCGGRRQSVVLDGCYTEAICGRGDLNLRPGPVKRTRADPGTRANSQSYTDHGVWGTIFFVSAIVTGAFE
jgi:hypothetical protein